MIWGGSSPDIYENIPLFNNALDQVKYEDNKVIYKDRTEYIKTFGDKLNRLTQNRTFDLATITFDDLLSTGNIDVIDNQELRVKIQNYYSNIKGTLDYEDYVVRPFYSSYVNVLQDIGLAPWSDIAIEHFKIRKESNKKFTTALQYLLNANLRHLTWANDLDKDIHEMKSVLVKELDNL